MDKQAHLRHRRSGEQKGTKRGLAGAGTPKCQAGWRAAECTECAAHPARLSLPGTQRGDTGDVPTASLLLSQSTPTPPRLSVHFAFHLPARALCNATVARVVGSVSQCVSLAAGEAVSLPLVLLLARGGPGLDGQGLNQPKVCCKPHPQLQQRGDSPETCSSHSSSVRRTLEVHHQVRRRYQTSSHLNYHLCSLAQREGMGQGQNYDGCKKQEMHLKNLQAALCF